MTGTDREHAQAAPKLEAYAAGLADPEAIALVRRHVATCPECRERLALLGPGPGDPRGEHLPEDLIAGWPRASASLRGITRALVRRHLERCADCRAELQLLGHAPELAVVPELEPAPGAARLLEPRVAVVPAPRPGLWQRLVVAWPVTGWALAGTALLVAVLVNPALLARLPWNRAGEPAATIGGGTAVPFAGRGLHLGTPAPAVAPAPGETGPARVTLAPGQAAIRLLAAPDPRFADDTPVRVTLEGPEGAAAGPLELPFGRLLEADGGVQVDAPRALAPGLWTMRVVGRDAAAAGDTLVLRFLLEPRGR